jgi:hypothetical protein
MARFKIKIIKKETNDLIEEQFELYNDKIHLAGISYTYRKITKENSGCINFKDINLSIFYSNGEFQNAWLNPGYIKPDYSILGFVQEFGNRGRTSDALEDRIKSVQNYIMTEEKHIVETYKAFLNLN